MSKVKNSFLDLVGNTPLVRVNNLIKKDELKAVMYGSDLCRTIQDRYLNFNQRKTA